MPYGTVNADVIQTSTSGGILGAGNASSMKNRIINGAMVIDQRNAGASITAGGVYATDRWATHSNTDGIYTVQQVTTAPTGFNNSLKATVTTADTSIGATQNALLAQYIEGYNVADLGFGTANAKTITLSFWVNSSITGTFTGALNNSAYDRSYPFSYTISAANTWEQKSVTIAGDTSGTWLTTNGAGIRVWFALAVGSSQSTTAGSWAAGTYYGATGQTNWMNTIGNVFYLTGVQLEVGSNATGYEYRQYQQEFALCQRYYQKLGNATGVGNWYNNTAIQAIFNFPVIMRTAPTASMTGALTFFDGKDLITETTGAVNDSDLCETGGRCNIGSFPSNTVAYRFYEFASPFSNNRYATFSAEL